MSPSLSRKAKQSEPQPQGPAPSEAVQFRERIRRQEELIVEIKSLREEVERLNGHRFFRIHDKFWTMVWHALARGLMMGLGTVVGATLLLSVLVWTLAQIEFIPIIGQWARQIIDIVQDVGDGR